MPKAAVICRDCGVSRKGTPWPTRGARCRVCATIATKEYRNTEKGLESARTASKEYCTKVYKTVEGRKAAKLKNKAYYASVTGRANMLASAKQRQKEKYGADSQYTIAVKLRSLVGNAIKRNGYKKSSSTAAILNCSFGELLQHLGCKEGIPEGAAIDHILPMALARSEADAITLNHYTNLQLLSAEANLEKSDWVPGIGCRARDLTDEQAAVIVEKFRKTL